MLLSLPSVVLGAKRLGAKRLGANRLGGETTCIRLHNHNAQFTMEPVLFENHKLD